MKILEIIIAASVAFALGCAWYGQFFKDHWKKRADNLLQPRIKATDYILLFLSMCAVSYFMNNGCLETHINGGTIGHGIFHGGLYGLSYAVPVLLILHVYQQKSFKQVLVDAGFVLIFFSAIGGMLALLPLTVY